MSKQGIALAVAVGGGLAGGFPRGSVQRYLMDARNAQGKRYWPGC